MINVFKRSEKLQEKINLNYDAVSRKTAQQLKEVKKKVKDLKHQIAKVSSNSSNNIDVTTTNLNSQLCVQEDNYNANRKSLDEARPNDRDRCTHKTIAAAVSIGKTEKSEGTLARQGMKQKIFISYIWNVFIYIYILQ